MSRNNKMTWKKQWTKRPEFRNRVKEKKAFLQELEDVQRDDTQEFQEKLIQELIESEHEQQCLAYIDEFNSLCDDYDDYADYYADAYVGEHTVYNKLVPGKYYFLKSGESLFCVNNDGEKELFFVRTGRKYCGNLCAIEGV